MVTWKQTPADVWAKTKVPMLRLTSVLACVILAACAGTRGTTPVRDPEAAKQFSEAAAKREKALATWEAAKAEERQYCETKAGDCKLQVGDQRDELISAHSVPVCRTQADSDHEASCIVEELKKRGDTGAAAKYVKSDLSGASRN